MGIIFSSIFSSYRFSVCLPNPDHQVLLCGLDNAGKSALLMRLKGGEFVETTPTEAYHVDSVECKGELRVLTIWEVSGREIIRPVWKCFFPGRRGVIFVVDSSDVDRLAEAKDELWRVAKADEMRRVPILIVANKQDLKNSICAAEIAHELDLDSLKDSPLHIQPASVVTGDGLRQGMKWLAEEILRGYSTTHLDQVPSALRINPRGGGLEFFLSIPEPPMLQIHRSFFRARYLKGHGFSKNSPYPTEFFTLSIIALSGSATTTLRTSKGGLQVLGPWHQWQPHAPTRDLCSSF
ncbi:hypothetical protein ACJZ2D_014729 [Fusarium nematophilum]